MNSKKEPSPKAKAITGLLILVVFIVISVLTWDTDKGGSKSEYSPNLAYTYAEGYVEDRLKSPSSAEFPGIFERQDHIKKLNATTFEIDSWVDSQNGFGAVVRTRFRCKIKFTGDKPELMSMTIE